jgi:hypothetical protein
MSVSFDWEFEEESKSSYSSGGGSGRPGQRRRWLVLGGVLLVLLAVGGLVGRAWVNNRLKAVEKIEAELRGIVELELKSLTEGDGELFRNRQDPADVRWQALQMARYIYNRADFTPAPGLIPADRPPEVKQAHVFGRTGRVELTFWFQESTRSQSEPTNSPTNPLPFHITWFYRLDDDGAWYHVAPPEDYWGIPYSWYGSWLVIRATQAEADLLDPVADDLANLVVQGCRALDCNRGLRYTLSFESTLLPQVQGNRWTLAALYLTGMPETEEARAAWLRAIKPWLVEALAQVTHTRIADRVLYHHLVARLQAELGVVELPSPNLEALTQALLEGRQHSLQQLWTAQYDPDDPEGNRLLDAEVAVLLNWLESQVGSERLFELLQPMHEYQQLDSALASTYRLSPPDLDVEWLNYLAKLTDVTSVLRFSSVQLSPTQPSVPPGDQIAFICDDRVWAGNADGSDVFALTSGEGSFESLGWSPDGRWLLTTWRPDFSYDRRLLYLLAADGSEGQLLPVDPTPGASPAGWSPDGREVIYYVQRGPSRIKGGVWATGVDTRETHQLPGLPLWSPDGRHVAYFVGSEDEQVSTVWLLEADPPGSSSLDNWDSARQIAERVVLWRGASWSPDGSKLALVVDDEDATESTLLIYDLATGRLTPLATPADLADVLFSEGAYLHDGAYPITLNVDTPRAMWVSGWSADGSHLMALGHWEASGSLGQASTVLAVLPLDGSRPRLLAHSRTGAMGSPGWSPTDPERLTFPWPTQSGQAIPNSYLFDLQAGLIYTATQGWNAAWSPDGAWVAFSGPGGVAVVDQEGQVRATLEHGDWCITPAWNPAADLSDLYRPVALTFTSSTGEWEFSNVRVYQDQAAHALHVWGQVVNHSGDDKRIVDLVPVVHDENWEPITSLQQHTFASGSQDLFQSVSLADGRSLPFGFTIHLPQSVRLQDDYGITMYVSSESVEPARPDEDLDIPSNDYDLSGWPDTFSVSGSFENPGPDLSEYAVIVVTVYAVDGQVMGLGWRAETNPTYLSSGSHDFEVEIQFSEPLADLELGVGHYKIQIFAR